MFAVPSPAKEVTETMGCFNAVRKHLLGEGKFDSKDAGTTALVIGDGSTPRVGALLALRTSWNCISVDPAFKTKIESVSQDGEVTYAWKNIARLSVIAKPIQEVKIKPSKLVVVMMHCHVDLEEALLCVESECELVGIVACPCCNFIERQKVFMGNPPLVDYRDQHMATPQNNMRVWLERNLDPTELRKHYEKRKLADEKIE